MPYFNVVHLKSTYVNSAISKINEINGQTMLFGQCHNGKSIRTGWGNCIMKKVIACDYSVDCWQVDKTNMAQGRITTPYSQRSAIVQSKCQHTITL
jgi:hypothetical protein